MCKLLSNNDDVEDDQNEVFVRPIPAPEQVFEMAIDQDNGIEENRNEDIPDELPDSRKTKGGLF